MYIDFYSVFVLKAWKDTVSQQQVIHDLSSVILAPYEVISLIKVETVVQWILSRGYLY